MQQRICIEYVYLLHSGKKELLLRKTTTELPFNCIKDSFYQRVSDSIKNNNSTENTHKNVTSYYDSITS